MRRIREYGWIGIIGVAFLALLMMYLIVDTEEVKASNRFYNDTKLSDEVFEYCQQIGGEYGISPELLMSIIETESTGNPRAYNAGCVGLMQVNPSYHADRMRRLGVTDLTDEYSNILVGTDYLAEMFTEEEDVALILSKFHGESRAYDTYEQGKLSSYAQGILERAEELTESHDRFSHAVG